MAFLVISFLSNGWTLSTAIYCTYVFKIIFYPLVYIQITYELNFIFIFKSVTYLHIHLKTFCICGFATKLFIILSQICWIFCHKFDWMYANSIFLLYWYIAWPFLIVCCWICLHCHVGNRLWVLMMWIDCDQLFVY